MVTTSFFISLINPGMSLISAVALLLLWHHQRQRRYLVLLAVSLLALTIGFLLHFLATSGLVSRLVANLLFFSATAGLALGTLGRFERALPLRAIGLTVAGGVGAFTWFLYVVPDINWRIYAVNFTLGTLALIVAAEIRAARSSKLIDNLLLGVMVFWGFTSFFRPVAVIWVDGPYTGSEQIQQTLYWITLTFSASLFLVLFTLTTTTAVALDVMEDLRRESQTDPLSGLLNRRGFEEGINAAIRQARRKGMPLALVVCDLDHFKSINDTYGHASGDNVIATFAGCLRRTLGEGHLIGRIGGEEFAILVQGANLSTARLFAEGARTAFTSLAIPDLPTAIRCSASFGVAEIGKDESVASLFDRADQALYQAKKAGRNCVRVSHASSIGSSRVAPLGAVDMAAGA
jgi:diguanylate cyclase (GGDEF)-like protein